MLAAKHTLLRILGIISVILFALLVCVTTWQVFTRQVLHSPSTWSEELSKLLFVWLSFIGGAYLYGERGHIAVDFLARRLGVGAQRGLAVFVQVIILIFALVAMVWGGYLASSIAWNQNLTALPFTIGWVYLVIPITGVCIAVFAGIHCALLLGGQEEPYPDVEEPEEPRDVEDAQETHVPIAASEGSK